MAAALRMIGTGLLRNAVRRKTDRREHKAICQAINDAEKLVARARYPPTRKNGPMAGGHGQCDGDGDGGSEGCWF